jgi:formylglycine-generating enzyme
MNQIPIRILSVTSLLLLAAPGVAGEPHFNNSLGMTMVRVEPGDFEMGSPQGETIIPSDRWDEGPRHRVTISRPFSMAATEVTNAQYEQFDPEHRKHRGLRGVSRNDNEAVTFVSWHDAVAFCEWLSEKEGKPYRLPTEAEWEYACRAGTTTPYWTGAELPEEHHRNQWTETGSRRVNAKDQVSRPLKGNVEVSLRAGAMPANPWGLHEMHGNVEEWVRDWYGPYPAAAQTDPIGPADGLLKITRGGSHNSALKYLRSANRAATLPEDRHWLIGFRVVQAPRPPAEPRPAEPLTMNDPTVDPEPVRWNEPADGAVFHAPIPLVRPDGEHPLLSELGHHHCPTITWCENGDLLAAWFNTISEIGREMVIVSSRLRYREGRWADAWDTARLFFAPADRNTTGSCLLHDGRGRIYYLNAIGDSGHHRDQSLMLSISQDSGRTWTRPRLISHPFRRHKYTPMDSAFVEDDARTVVVGMDYAPQGFKANEAGSGVFISRDRGATWENRLTGKAAPEVAEGNTGGLVAGFHLGVARLGDGRLLAMTRTQGGWDIGGRMTRSDSDDEGDTWTYRASPFPPIASGQRLVLMRLREGPLLLMSFHAEGMFAALSFDEGETWPTRRQIDGNRRGYLAATQTPDHLIHLITSRHHYRMNLAWLKE